MGKNRKGGKKHKKYKNNTHHVKKELLLAENGQEYFTITKMLGDGRCLGNGSDGQFDVLCIIRGNMKKKVWIHTDDIVLGSYRDFETKPVADIIHKYNNRELNELKKVKGINLKIKENDDKEDSNNDDDDFTFDDL